MGKQALRSSHADPPGRLDAPTDEPERQVHANNEANETRIKECEEELRNRWEAIVALRDVVIKQRMTIHSLKAERQDATEPTFPVGGNIRGAETISQTSTLSQSERSDEYDSFEEVTHNASPATSFDPSFYQDKQEEVMSAITCEAEESIDSSDFFKMEHQMRDVIESVKEQATPTDDVIAFGTPKTSEHELRPESKGGIQSVIESIEEQASHVDVVIALDRLQTVKSELQSVTNELLNRNAEVGELQNQVKVLESKIATLELERDLHVSLCCS